MAANEITFKIKVEKDGSLKVVAGQADKAAKATDNLGKSTDTLNKKRSQHQKIEKGVGQTGLSTAKGFSKQAGAITGGLVPAYAVLAANIFAITAAFNALKNAAQVQVLEQGFATLGNAVGRTSDLMASRLKEVTDGAISLEEALKAASAGFSAGFTIQEMEGLAEIAKGASIALGRDLGDALDRLIRGTAKLEPEILDELGIFIRLDDAVEKYASNLGKTSSELTEAQRRQAFLNEALEQGQKKFSLVTENADVNVFNQIGSSFRELSESFLQIVNVAIVPFMKFLAANMVVLTGAVLAFSLTVVKLMIPALKEIGATAQEDAEKMRALVPSLRAATKEAILMQTAVLKSSKTKIGGKDSAFSELFGKAKRGKASEKEIKKLTTMYNRSIAQRISANKKLRGAEKKAHAARTAELQAERAALQAIRAEILKTGTAQANVGRMEGIARGQEAVAEAMNKIDAPLMGVTESLTVAAAGTASYTKEIKAAVFENERLTKPGIFKKWEGRVVGAFSAAGVAARLFGVVLLKFLPHISAVLIIGGLLIATFKALFGRSKELAGPMNDLNKIMDTMPEKFEQLNTALEKSENLQRAANTETERAVQVGYQMEARFLVLNGIITESAGSFKELSGEVQKLDFGIFESWGLAIENNFTKALYAATDAWNDLKTNYPLLAKIVETTNNVIDGALDKTGEAFETVKEVITPDAEVTAINSLESQMRTLFNTLSEQEGVEGLDLERIFGKGVTTARDFVENLAPLPKNFKATSNETEAFEKKIARMNETMEKARLRSQNLVDLTKGLGDKMKDTGTKITTTVAKLQKLDEYEELSVGLNGLQESMKEAQKLFGDEEAAAVFAHQFETMGAALSKFGIEVADVKDKGPEAFNALKQALDDVIDAQRTVARDTAKINAELKKMDLAESRRKQERSSKQMLATFIRFGKFTTTAAQDMQNAKDDAGILATLEEDRATKKKKLIDLEIKLQISQIKLAQIGLDQDDEKFIALEAELGILKEIAKIKKGIVDEEEKTNLAKIKGDGLTQKMAAREKALSQTQTGTTANRIQGLATLAGMDPTRDSLVKKDTETEEQFAGRQSAADIADMRTRVEGFKGVLGPAMEELKKLGPEGELVATVTMGQFAIADSFMFVAQEFERGATKMEKGAAIAGAVATTISATASIMNAASQARIAAIDKEIAAEQKRDGKSKQSLDKIKQLEKKKEAEKRKAFEQNKKMQMAQTIANTAAAVMGVWAGIKDPYIGPNLATMVSAGIIALGAAQLAIIAGTSYSGGGSSGGSASMPSTVSVGKRRDSVDLAKSQSAGGELAYMRGARGTGGPENFRPAFYGKKTRATGGYVVGEQGPELFMPDRPGTIVPADDTQEAMAGASNVTFNISTIDATGVEEVLEGQQGNIIGMLRQAANSYGQEFFEDVDETIYTSPTARRA